MRILLLALPAICLALAACDPAPQSATRMAEPTEHAVSVTDAWIRLPAVGGRPASGYFTAAAGAMPEAIVNVTSPSPGRLEMHESMSDGGMSSMRQIETVPFEAGEPLMFEPGGKHLMLFSLDPTVKPGDTLALTFAFSRAQPVTVQAQVIAAGDPAPE
ncbi:copper chaperone PCu(A)C [Allosphingosinicella sp.]|uniref:copper chaperone PCu(A)C n=1 Tax=Allosphingosinicella sp. TaxID=2823234 RepID=UPI002FC15823